jgi:hypothetical protein
MVAAPVVLVALLLSAENLEIESLVDAPARGSVNGPWALIELSGATSLAQTVTPSPVSISAMTFSLGGELAATGGIGFQVRSVRFSPTARFSMGPRLTTSTIPGSNFVNVGWSALGLALAAPDLIDDTGRTGLRFTPVFGVTVPTSPGAFVGNAPVTTLSLAGQLERRFGTVELAYRLEGSSAPCLIGAPSSSGPFSFGCGTTWVLSNRLFAEGWLAESFSVALGMRWLVRWTGYSPPTVPGCAAGSACDPTLASRLPAGHNLSVEARATWAFTQRFGTTLELNFAHLPPASPFQSSSTSIFGGSFIVWFRTDAIIQRNWLDR